MIKEKIEKELLANIPESSLEVIIAENYKNEIRWEDKGKEFSLNGVMYDVAKIIKKNDRTYLYCINDKKEKELLDDFLKAVDHNQANGKQSSNILKSLVPDLIVLSFDEALTISHYTQRFFVKDEEAVSSYIKISTPPPRV